MLLHTLQFDRHTITDASLYIDEVASRRIILMSYKFYLFIDKQHDSLIHVCSLKCDMLIQSRFNYLEVQCLN